MKLWTGNENYAVPLYVCMCAGHGFSVNCNWSHIIMYMYVYHHTITTYVRAQSITKKQAVACIPQMFLANTLNIVSPVDADSHTSVCVNQ